MILPVAGVYALIVWTLAGLITSQWWPQLSCLAASCYLLIEISNSNALVRIRSRMVTTTFIFLSTMFVSGFASLTGGMVQLCFVTAILLLFNTYQDNQSVGKVFYAFLSIGLSSLFFVHILYLVPVIWILMATQLQSFSGRTLAASIIGLVTPYWFIMLWFIYQQDFSLLVCHFSPLVSHFIPDGEPDASSSASVFLDYSTVTLEQMLVYVFLVALSVAGIIHFWNNSFEDKIRIRLLYGFFTTITLLMLVLLALLPRYFDPLIRLAFICASPLVAHFLTLTSTRITNIAFFVIIVVCIVITAVNLWMLS